MKPRRCNALFERRTWYHRAPKLSIAALVGADDFEVPVDENVVRPVDANVVNLVLAVAQLHNTVDDAPG